MTFGGHRPPSLEPKYEVTVKDKMLYHAITVQPAYENYSFEELRYASPALQRQSETMLVSQKKLRILKLFSIQKLHNSTLTRRCLGSRYTLLVSDSEWQKTWAFLPMVILVHT